MAEMQEDAETNDALREQRLRTAQEAEERQERRDKLRAMVMHGKTGFLGDTRRSAYQGEAVRFVLCVWHVAPERASN